MNTMKRIVILLSVLCLTVGSHAQSDGTAVRDSILTSGVPNSFSINLGVTVGATLYANGNDLSPYYSNHGFTVQIPFTTHWDFSPHWRLSAGVRYDFCWDPLYYAVEPILGEWRFEEPQEEFGLQFNQTPTTGTQKAYAYRSYLGIPIEIKWYPWQERNRLGIAFDLVAAYAVTQYIDIDDISINLEENSINKSSSGYRSTFNAMNPWKLEVGLSFTTGLLGLTHGIRFFTNLLPTYTDPTTGEKIYTSGMTMFL